MDIPASIEELMEQFTRVGLVKRCEALGLDTSGSKEELAGRIVEHSKSGNQDTTRVGDYLDAVEQSSTSSRESVDREARGVSIHVRPKMCRIICQHSPERKTYAHG